MRNPVFLLLLLVLGSCSTEPQPIEYGRDQCALCKMTIMDKKFGAELINKNGKVLKFDSGECMVNYLKADAGFEATQVLVTNYAQPETLIDAQSAVWLHGGEVNSPMGGKLAAFGTSVEAEKFNQEMNAQILNWEKVKALRFR